MKFESKKKIESVACPGASFVIHRMTEGKRNKLRLRLAKPLAELRAIQGEIDALPLPRTAQGEVDQDAVLDPAVVAKILTLQDRIHTVNATEIDPAYVDTCFVSINGVEIDGVSDKIDAALLRESGPEELYREIVAAIRAEAELTAAERKNSESPTTSVVVVGGPETSTTATFAEPISCI